MVEKEKDDEIKAEDDGNEEVRKHQMKSLREINQNCESLQETCTKAPYPSVFGKTVTLPMLMKSGILTPGKSTMSIEYMVSSGSGNGCWVVLTNYLLGSKVHR